MTAAIKCRCGLSAAFVRRTHGVSQVESNIYKCECGLWHSVSVDAGDIGAVDSRDRRGER